MKHATAGEGASPLRVPPYLLGNLFLFHHYAFNVCVLLGDTFGTTLSNQKGVRYRFVCMSRDGPLWYCLHTEGMCGAAEKNKSLFYIKRYLLTKIVLGDKK